MGGVRATAHSDMQLSVFSHVKRSRGASFVHIAPFGYLFQTFYLEKGRARETLEMAQGPV
jgi:hypothetical protein